MPSSLRFILIRALILSLLVGSQLYLFVQGDRALRRSRLSRGRQRHLRAGLAAFFASIVVVYSTVLLRGALPQNPPAAILYGLLYPTAIWSFGSLFSCLLLLAADAFRWVAARVRARLLARRSAHETVPDVGRRRFVETGLMAIAATPVIISGYGASFESTGYRIEEVDLPLWGTGRLSPPLRVVQVSDIHSGPFMTVDRMRQCAAAVQQLEPDLFVLTGDFISNSIAYLGPCVREMARVRSRYGSFAVLGNHEHWYGRPDEIIAVFEAEGIQVLQNANRIVATDCGLLAIAGIDDLLVGRPDLERALDGIGQGLPTILLSHRPEIFPEAAAREIGLTLSGHYHGGQVKLNMFGLSLSIAHLLTAYTEGLYRLGRSHLYVNRGLGTTGTPVRLNAPPEITLLKLS
jgi:hypothetical protein